MPQMDKERWLKLKRIFEDGEQLGDYEHVLCLLCFISTDFGQASQFPYTRKIDALYHIEIFDLRSGVKRGATLNRKTSDLEASGIISWPSRRRRGSTLRRRVRKEHEKSPTGTLACRALMGMTMVRNQRMTTVIRCESLVILPSSRLNREAACQSIKGM